MQLVISPQQMRNLEASAFQMGVPTLLLMENAAREACKAIREEMSSLHAKDILFLVGKGNNGGDGLALARLCHLEGAQCRVLLLEKPATPDALANLAYAKALGIPFIHGESGDTVALQSRPDCVVDAVYGTGFNGDLPAYIAAVAREVNAWEVPIFALDIPSGINALDGSSAEVCFHPTHTLALGHLKTGHCLAQGRGLLGRLEVLDLGIPHKAYDTLSSELTFSALEEKDLAFLLPKRASSAHKGSNGRVLTYAGSLGMAGAAAMAATASLRAGAGLVTLVCEEALMPILQTLVPGATCLALSDAIQNKPKYDIFLVGCGLGRKPGIFENIKKLWDPEKPSVWDADALNLLAEHPQPLGDLVVLTPHPGEAARLLGTDLTSVLAQPLEATKELHNRYGGTIVLKGAVSIIHAKTRTAFNLVGSPSLAKGGSGDALAGLVAGLLAQNRGKLPVQSAQAACLWLGMAGKAVEKAMGVHTPLTTDVLNHLGEVAK